MRRWGCCRPGGGRTGTTPGGSGVVTTSTSSVARSWARRSRSTYRRRSTGFVAWRGVAVSAVRGVAGAHPEDHVEGAEQGDPRAELGDVVRALEMVADVGGQRLLQRDPPARAFAQIDQLADLVVVDRDQPGPLAGQQLAGRDAGGPVL